VVGLEELHIDARGIEVGARRIAVGETISLDGASGAVYEGIIRVREGLAPEATKLLEWAHELGIEIPANGASGVGSKAGPSPGEAEAEVEVQAEVASPDPARGEVAPVEAILRSLSIRGASTPEALGSALCVAPEAIAAPLEVLESAGQVGPGRPLGVALTEAGRERAAQLLAADCLTLGAAAAVQALDAFQPLDQRLKQAVSDWQMRWVAGEVVLNDHRDAAWDAGVFARLAEIREEFGPWLTTLADDLPRLLVYLQRLASALEAARSGDGRFVASPRVDSVHGIWFELHEDLIRLAGRTRAAEVAAGRAG
jgi:pyruvate,orthophosphate dikinase